MSKKPETRNESDSMGTIAVPADRYWGAQTQRSLQNFRIGGERLPDALVRALGIQKLAACRANMGLGVLDKKRGRAIERAAKQVAAGDLTDHFPLVVWQTGSGTQSNMNANEVIAGCANEILSGQRGGKDPVHPNDHCNMGQSSNDTFPTAMHIAAAQVIAGETIPALERLRRRARRQGQELRQDHQDRPHPPDGRDPADPGPGVLRLRPVTSAKNGIKRLKATAAAPPGAGPGRHRRRHGPQRHRRLRRGLCRRGREDHGAALRHRARTSSRPWPPTMPWWRPPAP